MVAPTAAYALRSASADMEHQMKAVPLRFNFAESAFFSALLTTDEQGKVRVNFRLPDTQTAYHLELFSYGKQLEQQLLTSAELRVQKPLSIRLSLPRYLMQGDTLVGNNITAAVAKRLGHGTKWQWKCPASTPRSGGASRECGYVPLYAGGPCGGTALKLEGQINSRRVYRWCSTRLPSW